MSSLLLKEFYTQRKGMAGGILAVILTSPIIFRGGASLPPIYYAILFSCFSVIVVHSYDYKNTSDVLINSLPVSRREIITSKYVATLLMSLVMSVAVLGVFTFFDNPADTHDVLKRLVDVIIAVAATGLLITIYFPLYYLLGQRFILFGLIGLSVLFFTVFPIIFHLVINNGFWRPFIIWQEHPAFVLLTFCTITALAMLVSRSISIRLYEKKEF